MKVFNFPLVVDNKPKTIVLGEFEYLHIGHKELITEAKKLNMPIMITLMNHSEKYDKDFLNIRLNQLAECGVDYVVIINLTSEIKNQEGILFLEKIISNYNIKNIVIGKDFKMGKNRGLDAIGIKKIWPQTFVVPLVKINDKKISSSFLKELLISGEIELFNKLSISPFTTMLKIDKQKFQANLNIGKGIYAGWVTVGDYKHFAVARFGLDDYEIIIPDAIKDLIGNYEFQIITKIRSIITMSTDNIVKDDFKKANIKINEYLKNNGIC